MKPTSYINRETTKILKGIALIFMFIHHFFTWPDWYVEGISYPSLTGFAEIFRNPFKMCVPVFAFLTGYFYSYCKTPDYKYSLKKILNLLVSYWIIYIPFLLIAIFIGTYTFDWKNFALELSALNRPIMVFCWYVCFYCVSMLLLPLLRPLLSDTPGKAVFWGILLPVALTTALLKTTDDTLIMNIFINLRQSFPCITMGYICAHYSSFEKMQNTYSSKIKKTWLRFVLWMLLAGLAFMGRYYMPSFSIGSIAFLRENLALPFNMDIFYAPVFVYALVNMIQTIPQNFIFKILSVIGKYSLQMWFVSCIFFSKYTKAVFQPILYLPHNPILVLLWGLLICLVFSVLADIPVKYIYALTRRSASRK